MANAWAVEIAVDVESARLAIVAVGIGCASRVFHEDWDCARTPVTSATLEWNG